MSKKRLLSSSPLVIMIAIVSLSSLAWFNDSDSVKNEDGVISDDEKEQTGLKFENILPGATYDKNPTVENTGAYDQYIRVVVTLSDAQAWMEILGRGYDLSTIFVGHDENLWTRSDDSGVKGENLVYVYYLDKILKPDETVAVFTDVKLPTSLTQQQMAKLNGGFELSIRADAIQTECLGDGVDTAA